MCLVAYVSIIEPDIFGVCTFRMGAHISTRYNECVFNGCAFSIWSELYESRYYVRLFWIDLNGRYYRENDGKKQNWSKLLKNIHLKRCGRINVWIITYFTLPQDERHQTIIISNEYRTYRMRQIEHRMHNDGLTHWICYLCPALWDWKVMMLVQNLMALNFHTQRETKTDPNWWAYRVSMALSSTSNRYTWKHNRLYGSQSLSYAYLPNWTTMFAVDIARQGQSRG